MKYIAPLWVAKLKYNPTKMHKKHMPLALGAIGFVFSAVAAQAQQATAQLISTTNPQLTDVVVKGHSSVQAALARLNKIPGGVSVVSSDEVSKGREATNADLLKLQPGVIAASTGGTDSIKVSIRGSGVNNGVGYFRNGIKYEFDGLPITTPSGTPYELFEPQGLNYTEILRGNNAFTTGDLALGGTINYVTKTGRTAPYTELRTEFGSFGYVKGTAATGGVVGPWDYYLIVTGERQDGWQDHTRSNATHFAVNIGYKFNENVETRVFFRYGRELFQGPGALTRGQIESDNPRQAQLSTVESNYVRNQPGSELIGDVTKIRLDDNQNIELGLAYQNFPIIIGWNNTSTPIQGKWDYGNVAAQAKYTNNSEIFGHGNEFTAAAYWSDDIYGDVKQTAVAASGTYPFGSSMMYNGVNNRIAATSYYNIPGVYAGERLYQNKFNGSIDATVILSNDFEVVKNVWLTLGGSIVVTPRNFNTIGWTANPATNYTTQIQQSLTYHKTEANLLPRLGLRWDVNKNLQLFTNYGGNVEPKEDWAGGYGPYSSNARSSNNYGVFNLENQVTETFEVGFRGRYSLFQGSADYYHANVRDELLTLTDTATNITSTLNAPPAVHQGLEVALDTLLWQGGLGTAWDASNGQQAKLHLVQTYNWSSFHFTGGSALGHNEEPGLPEHFYQGELAFEHPSGFYANFDARVSSGVWVDYMNTFKAAPYVVYGLTAGWQQPRPDKKGWQVSLTVDNLTNAKYAIAVAPTYSAAGKDIAAEYPGQGLGFFSSIDYKF